MILSIALVSVFLTSRIFALPLSTDAEISLPTESAPTLATDLLPPLPPKEDEIEKRPVLFLINLYGVKNKTGNEEVLQDDILSEVPDISAPFTSLLLVVEADNEDTPVNLEELYKDLESEGLKVEKIKGENNTIKLIKVDIDIDSYDYSDLSNEEIGNSDDLREKREIEDGGLIKLRVRKHICLKCKLHSLHEKIHRGHGGYGGGYGGGYPSYGGGGCNVCGYQPRPQPPPRPVCHTCGGGGYPYGGGGGGGYSQASAQASASASAQSYSRY